MKKYVLMIVPDNFPEEDAGSVRDQMFSKMYQDLGYEVILIGKGIRAKKGIYDGTHFYSVYNDKCGAFHHFSRYRKFLRDCSLLLRKFENRYGRPQAIHLSELPYALMKQIANYSLKTNVPVLYDSTEWYSPCEFKYGVFNYVYQFNNILNKYVIKKPMRIIAISSYLEKYFSEKGLKTVRIPVLMDTQSSSIPNDERTEERVKLIYAGSHYETDHIDEVVKAINGLSLEEQKKVEFHLVGVDEKILKKYCKVDSFSDSYKFYGRVSREKVLEILRKMDFSVLLRPSNERYAKAGFPTKAVEAMTNGVSLICNISSDLGMYLKNGENAVIVKDYTANEMAKGLKYLVSLSRKDINRLKNNAKATADQYFDYHKWENKLEELIR